MNDIKIPVLPKTFYIISLICFLVTTILHWRLAPNILILLYFLGALVGIFLLEIAERIVNQVPSPFRSVLVQVILWVLAIFALTSSSGALGRGVVLFMNLRLLYLQISEFKQTSQLNSWFSQVNLNLDNQQTKIYLNIALVLFIFQALLFILV